MMYFVTVGNKREIDVIKELKPNNLLISYFFFKTKGVKPLLDYIGYHPNIILDSGAYSAWTRGKNIALPDYIDFVIKNKHLVNHYISLDMIDDHMGDEFSKRYYDMMLLYGLEPIPVYHEQDDITYLDYYVECEPPFIALGGTANNRSKIQVREWVKSTQERYPKQAFHLLGSSSKQITDHVQLRSFDSTTWIMQSFNGKPKHIVGTSSAKTQERMFYNMSKLMEEYA